MRIEVQLDENCQEPKVIVVTNAMTNEVQELIKNITEQVADSSNSLALLVGFREGEASVLEPERIVRIYANKQKVFAISDTGEYMLRLRLYELEKRLGPEGFVRISSSEIINLKMVKNFDLSFAGTICVNFKNGETAYASRRYVAKVKQLLGI